MLSMILLQLWTLVPWCPEGQARLFALLPLLLYLSCSCVLHALLLQVAPPRGALQYNSTIPNAPCSNIDTSVFLTE